MDQGSDVALNGQLAEVQGEFVAALVNSGVMGKIRAQLRAAAVAMIQDDGPALKALGAQNVSAMPDATKIALLLVDDFLRSSPSLKMSHGVFHEESCVQNLESNKADLQQPIVDATAHVTPPLQSLLETLVAATLAPRTTYTAASTSAPALQEAARSSLVRAPSPDIEIPPAVRQQAVPSSSVGVVSGAGSNPGSRRGSASAPNLADALEDSVEYSDRSANSSLDFMNCVALERFSADPGVPSSAAAPRGASASKGATDETTSEDDF